MSGLLPALGGGGGGSGGLSGLLSTQAALQVAAGGLSGLIAMSAAIATGVVPVGGVSDESASLALVDCPGSGSIVALAHTNDRMLVTAQSEGGLWLRVYVPGPIARDGWAPAESLELLADGSGLPVAGCGEVAAAQGTPSPSATATVVAASPSAVAATARPTATPKATPKPTSKPTATPQSTPQPTSAPAAGSTPTPTHPPTPTPNVGPVFTSGPTSSVPTMFADPSGEGDCWGLPRRTTIKVVVGDPDGVRSVQLWVKKPGASAFAQLTHNFSNQTSYWSAFIDAYYDHINAGGTMSFYAVAVDGTGLTTKSSTGSVAVRQCDTDASVSVSIDLSIDADGIYHVSGNCTYGPVPWYFAIRDPDGAVKTAALDLTKTNYYSTTHQSVTLHQLTNPVYWYGESTTLDSTTTTTWVLRTTDVTGGTTVAGGSVRIYASCIK